MIDGSRQEGLNDANDAHLKAATLDANLVLEAIEYAHEQPTLVAFRGHAMGIDEVLYGRAGLLWAVLLLRQCSQVPAIDGLVTFGEKWERIYGSIPRLVDKIVTAGSDHDAAASNDINLPTLTWPWLGSFYGLGAMHGSTGILCVLLSARHEEISAHAPAIASTITQLCAICTSNQGQLPMSVPAFPSESEKSSPLVQLCHGVPGLLLLLACARQNREFWTGHRQQEWEDTFALGSQRLWEQGLLSKGGGICHGIAGNALPWLLWCAAGSETTSEHDTKYLGWALAFLKECTNTTPFGEAGDEKYRTPDHPYSLFEGLAGTTLVWLEAIRVCQMRLRVS